jgi:hypothetical protein
MLPSTPLTAVTAVTATAVLAGLLAAPSTHPSTQASASHAPSDVSVGAAAQHDGARTVSTVPDGDPAHDRLPLNGDLTATAPTTVPGTDGAGWTTLRRQTTRTVTVGGVGTVPVDAFGAHLKVTGRWSAKKDLGVLEVRDPELAGDYSIVQRPGTTSSTSTEDISTTLAQDGTVEVVNHSGTDIAVKVEVLGWYADPDPQADVGTGVEEGFELIESIPDAETTTQEDIDVWLAEQGLERPADQGASGTAIRATYDPRHAGAALTAGAGACVTAVIVAVLSNVFLPAKVLKVKAAIKAVGGTKKAYSALRKAYKAYRKAGHGRSNAAKKAFRKVFNRRGISQQTRDTLVELTTVGPVLNSCF